MILQIVAEMVQFICEMVLKLNFLEIIQIKLFSVNALNSSLTLGWFWLRVTGSLGSPKFFKSIPKILAVRINQHSNFIHDY